MGMGGRSHLAGAAGTGLSLGNEALAVLHLPALVVAVCRDQGPEGVRRAQGDFGGFRGILRTHPSSYPHRRGSTDPRGGRGRSTRWHIPEESRPPSPAARDGRDPRGPGVRNPGAPPELFPATEPKTGLQPTGREPQILWECPAQPSPGRCSSGRDPAPTGRSRCWKRSSPCRCSLRGEGLRRSPGGSKSRNSGRALTCRAVGAALPGNADGIRTRLHTVRALAAHGAVCLQAGTP